MKKSLFSSLVFCALALSGSVSAHADVVSLQSTALIPQGTTCAPLLVSDMKTYVYDNELHSFEFIINDAAYTMVGGSVGDSRLSFNQSSRSAGTATGTVRIQVNVESTPLTQAVPVSVSLLSSKGGGAPVCATIFSFVMSPMAPLPSLTQDPVVPSPVTPSPVSQTDSTQGYTPPVKYPTVTNPMNPEKDTTSVKKPFSLPSIGLPSLAGITGAAAAACSTARSAGNIWSILLVLYALFVAYCALTKPGILARSAELLAAAIVLPFIGLVAFWYLSEQCRAGEWVQLLTPAIALIGLAVAFWDETTPSENGRLPL